MNHDSISENKSKRSQLDDYDEFESEPHEFKKKRLTHSPPRPSGPVIPNSDYFQIKLPGQKQDAGPQSSGSANAQQSDFVMFRTSQKSIAKSLSDKHPHKTHNTSAAYERSRPYNVKKSLISDYSKGKHTRHSRDSHSEHSQSTSGASANSYKSKFEKLTNSWKLPVESLYKVQVKVRGRTFTSSDCRSADDAEQDVFKQAYEFLLPKKSTFQFNASDDVPMISASDSDTLLISQIKDIFQSQDTKTLFKTEFPVEYKILFGKNIPDNWFEIVQNASLFFHVKNKIGTNMTTVTLL